MSDRRPYSRVYWSILDDGSTSDGGSELDRFATIRGDMRHLGSWALMLVVADMAYPAPAFIPPTVPKASVAALSRPECGLVELIGGGMYRIHGLRKERESRAAAASRPHPKRGPRDEPPEAQLGPKRDPDGSQPGGGRVARRDEDETRQDENEEGTPAPLPETGPDAANSLFLRTGQFPSKTVNDWLNDLSEAHTESRLIAAIDSTPLAGRNVKDYLVAIRDQLRAQDHAAEKAERADEIRRNAAKRAPVKSLEEREAEYRAQKAIEAELMGRSA